MLYKILVLITKERLRLLLNLPLPGEVSQWKMAPQGRNMRFELNSRTLKRAAVLIPFLEKDAKPHILLTLRSVYDGIHSAQVSFPGGKFEESESEARIVALREAEEEIGIVASQIEIIGSLSPLVIPVSSMLVYPIVGWIKGSFQYKPNPREVQRVIEYPIEGFTNDRIKSSNDILRIKDQIVPVPYFDVENEKVWGATAMIISELIDVIQSKRIID